MSALSRLRAAELLAIAHDDRQWPPDDGGEVAVAGRSNVGKSSALNALTGNRGLARTSRTPGRTRQIVFFALAPGQRLVDLPGYGYAEVPEHVRRHWQQSIERYFASRQSLRGLLLLMDCRHPLTVLDRQMLDWTAAQGHPVHVLLTKADKLGRGQAAARLAAVRRELEEAGTVTGVQLFSARAGTGREQAAAQVMAWIAGGGNKKAPDKGEVRGLKR